MDIGKFRAGILKIFVRLLLTFFVLIFGVVLLMQTPPVKHQIKNIFITSAKQKGITLTIDQLDGNFPFEWKFKNVSAQWQQQSVSFESIKARMAIFPLFKKHIEITHLKMHKGFFNGTPFEGTARGRVDLQKIKPIKISHFLLEGEDLYLKFEGKIQSDFSLQEGNLSFHFPDASILSPFLSKGSLTGSGSITKQQLRFDCTMEDIQARGISFTPTLLKVEGEKNRNQWLGTANFSGGPYQAPFQGQIHYRLTPSCRLLSIENLQLTGPQTHLFGKVDLDPSFKCLEGTLFLKMEDLKTLQFLFPDTYLRGSLGSKIDFQSFSDYQDMKCQIEAKDLCFGQTQCQSLTFEGTFYDLFGDLRGEFALESTKFEAPNLQLEEIAVNSVFDPNTCPFSLYARGNFGGPLEIQGEGNWEKNKDSILVEVHQFKGHALQKSFALTQPFSLNGSFEHFKLQDFDMNIGGGHLFSHIDLSQTTSTIKILAEEFPLEFIPLPHKYFTLGGIGNLEADLTASDHSLKGTCHATLKRALFVSEDNKETLTTKGSLQMHFHGKKVQIHGEMKAKEGQFAQFFSTLPIEFEPYPFKICLDQENPFSAQLVAEGKIEEFLNFINIGHQRIEGWLTTNLYFSKTLDKPMLQGEFELQDGLYENYFSGTCVKAISAKGYVNKQNATLTDLYGVDGKGGSVTAQGTLLLNRLKKFPFSLSGKLNQFEAVTFDTVTGNFSGNITISGDTTGATARGELSVDEAVFTIPDHLPTALPELPIAFLNPPESLTRKKELSMHTSPLILDLDLDVPGKAFVEGRGLSAELKGKVHLTGNFIDITANGNLQLVHGEYIFSGKVFDLTQGEVLFNDKPTPSSYISLSGNCDLPDVNVTVMLRGPVTSPSLSFQSSPQMPTSSLLSQILFNKDISEISAAQALQVAQTVISLSGNSAPDVLGKIRKTLGIDRLTIITSENDPGKISLQIGKYLMRGVLLTLSQGAESRNVSVEVDLKKGIRFQAEMNEDQQGKFSLKWHHHY